MDRPGKTTFKILTEQDIPQIQIFCKKCEDLGYENNSSLEKMKFDKATFFGAFDNDTLFSLAGVERFPIVNDNSYRCLFRGAQLPGYTPKFSLNIFESGIHFSQFLYMQIKYIQQLDSNPEFYITANVNNPAAGKSNRMHKTMMPRLSEKGYWDLVNPNMIIYNTEQSLWKVNVDYYLKARTDWLSSIGLINHSMTVTMK